MTVEADRPGLNGRSEPTRTVSTRLPLSECLLLDDLAALDRVNVSDIARDALTHYLQHRLGDPESRAQLATEAEQRRLRIETYASSPGEAVRVANGTHAPETQGGRSAEPEV